MKHQVLGAIMGVSQIVIVYRLARRGLISFRYATGWLLLGILGLISIALIYVLNPIAGFLDLSPIALIVLLAIILLVSICIQLSISISGLHDRQNRVAEEIAHLKLRIDEIMIVSQND